MKYKEENYTIIKINKMFLLSEESEKYKSEELITGKNIGEKHIKYEWILQRFFEEDLKEINDVLKVNNNIDIYFFTETRRWEEVEETSFGRSKKVIRTKVGFSLQKIFFNTRKEFKEYKKLPWI